MVTEQKIKALIDKYPLLNSVIETSELFWENPKKVKTKYSLQHFDFGEEEVRAAERRLDRFASYIQTVYPETAINKGIIESPLVEIAEMKNHFNMENSKPLQGKVFLKCDYSLPISGSIKARGGIYEVLKYAETIALKKGLLHLDDDYSKIRNSEFKALFSKHSIVVGSTGNLGLSIGIISSKLGFNVTVHMSQDAKEWKKTMLREKGVKVVEHKTDYGNAVAEGRKEATGDPFTHFVDDENSKDLFFGYAVAANRLKKQLLEMDIIVDENHPLFVYLPCGVGGGPGGVAFGLKLIFGDDVHCFFAEPTHSPSMLVGLITGMHDEISVQDLGVDNKTEADGLAVGRPSQFVGKVMDNMLNGIYTVSDENMFKLLRKLADVENIYMEPSALTSIAGPSMLFNDDTGIQYLTNNHLTNDKMLNATHICWGTGGGMVPKNVMQSYVKQMKK